MQMPYIAAMFNRLPAACQFSLRQMVCTLIYLSRALEVALRDTDWVPLALRGRRDVRRCRAADLGALEDL